MSNHSSGNTAGELGDLNYSNETGMAVSSDGVLRGNEHHLSLFGTSAQGAVDTFGMEPENSQMEAVPGSSATSFIPNSTGVVSSVIESDNQQQVDMYQGNDVEELKRKKIQLEQELFVANEQQSSLQSQLLKLNETLEIKTKELELLVRDRGERMSVMRELEAQRDKLMLAKNDSEQKVEVLLRQRDDFEAKINRLTHDKNLLSLDLQSVKANLEKEIQKKVLMEAKVDEFSKDRRLFQFEKERWAQEKEIYLHNKEWFMNEIRDRDKKLSVLKIESLHLTAELQAEKASLSEECEVLHNEINSLKSLLNQRDEQISDLNRSLREVVEDRSAKLNKLEEELLTSERLIGVYKETSEEAERNLQELNLEYEERGHLLDEAKEEFQNLRIKLDEQQTRYEEELNEKNKKIHDLEEELIKANELIQSKHRLSLTDEEVSELSPAAAAAAALIKNGVSLTAIYREHSRVVAELEESKAQISRLEEYIGQFIEDLERKAPLLAQQRSECERLAELSSALREQLQSADDERQRLISARDSASRELAYTKAELERTQRDNEDLSRQARHLLHASEVTARDRDSPPISDEDRDILWSSIGELQKVNQKLMSDLRSVKATHQQIVQEANQAEISRLSESLDEAIKKLETLKEQSSKQNMIIEKLKEQRDTYKRLSEEKKAENAGSIISKELESARELVKQLHAQVDRSERCLEIYREEKLKSDKILQDRIEQQFNLISELRTTNGRLEADIAFQRQTQQTLTKQSESDATELELAKERLAKIEADKRSLEERLRFTETQLFESRAEVGKHKSELDLLNEQVSLLRSSEARLHQELFIVREGNYSNEKMAVTLQQLQSRLELSEDKKLKSLEDQLTVLRNENEALKTFISEITEQHRIVSSDLKMTSSKIKTERDQALASKKSAEDRLSWRENEFTELQAKYDTLIKQLNAPDSSLDTTAEGCRKEAQQLRNRNNYLENQLKDVRANLETVEKKLAIREKEIEEMAKLSGEVESTLVEQNATNAAETQSLKAMLDLVNTQLKNSTDLVCQLRLEVSKLEMRCSEEASNVQQVKLESQREIAVVEKRLTNTEAQRLNAEMRVEEATKRILKLEGEMEALEEDRKHLKGEAAKVEEKLVETENKLRALSSSEVANEAKVKELQETYQNEISVLRVEKSRLEEMLRETREEIHVQARKTDALNDIMLKLSQRNVFLERSSSSEDSALVDPAYHSTSAVSEIVKYLQNENHQAMERTLSAELQWKRLKAQVADYEERQTKLEDDLKRARADAEAGVRALGEKSEMVSRLSLLEGVQRELAVLKSTLEKATSREELLSKKVNDLESRIRVLDAEKTNDKGKLQNLTTDLQNCRKEADSWKERHAEAMTALSKIGPEKVVSLTGEIEALKRQIASMTVELGNGKRQAEESVAKHKAELDKLNTTIQQLRVLAKNYKAKYLALTSEKEILKKELSVAKPSVETSVEKSESSAEAESAEISNLKQQLLTTRHELEKFKQKLAAATPRTGWPVDAMASSSNAKGPSVLQAQMKQIESLNNLNKDLKSQLEVLANRYKEAQDELAAVRNELAEVQAEKDAAITEKEVKEEELRFRLNSITSMLTKKEGESVKLRSELDSLKVELEKANNNIMSLENALENYRKGAAASGGKPVEVLGAGVAAEPSGASAASLVKPVSSTTFFTRPESGIFPESRMLTSTTASKTQGDQIEAITGLKEASSLDDAGTSASFVGEQRSMGGPLKRAAVSPEHAAVPAKQPSVSTTSEQSNAVSQSSGVIFSTASANSMEPNKPAQQNVISGSGDGLNVISSSGNSHALDVTANSSSMAPGTSVLRKRQLPAISDQSSSMESGSDLQETVKRQRVSPSEQVSTSGRFLQQGIDARLQKEKHVTDDDGAEQEQQESVETTTNPEDEGVGEDYLEDDDRNLAQQEGSVKEDRNVVEELDAEQLGGEVEEEGYQEEVEGEAGDEEAPEDEKAREEYLDDTLGEGGEEEYEDEMDEDEDYDDEEDYEGVEEEMPDVRSRRPMLIAPRSQQSQPVDDEEVIVIEDDDEEDQVSHSQSPADQSTDEADEGPRASAYRPDTSNETNRAERENESGHHEGHLRLLHDNGEGSDRLELQQPRRALEANRPPRSVGTGNGDSEVSSVPSGELELLNADTTAHSAGGIEVSNNMHSSASHDSSLYVVNIESDSRGASSTVTPPVAVLDKQAIADGSSTGLEDDEGGNEVAEEEQGAKPGLGSRAAQTDDEAGVSEPTTSGDSRQRRTRILYPDIDEPSSSSTERAHGMPPTLRGRGWGYRARRAQPRRRP